MIEELTIAGERTRLQEERWGTAGTTCAACDQKVKVYRRNIYGKQAVELVELVKRYEQLLQPD